MRDTIDLRFAKRRRLGEEGIKSLLLLSALLSIFTTAGIIAVLGRETWDFFREVPVFSFLFGLNWTPLLEPRSYGVLPLLGGTTMIVVGSALIALPVGLGSAIFLSEYASERTRSILKPILEILAGVPTVVYGYFALTTVTPLLRSILPQTKIFNAASASVVVGIMILPMVASLATTPSAQFPLLCARLATLLALQDLRCPLRW